MQDSMKGGRHGLTDELTIHVPVSVSYRTVCIANKQCKHVFIKKIIANKPKAQARSSTASINCHCRLIIAYFPNALRELHSVDLSVLKGPSISSVEGCRDLRSRAAAITHAPLRLQEELNTEELPCCERITRLHGASREGYCTRL